MINKGGSKDRLFGTNGVRGVVNEFLTAKFSCKLGMAIGTFLKSGTVVIGTDTRSSNHMIKSAMVSGLTSVGINIIDVGIVPTPVVQFAVKYFHGDHGIVITASHNPPQFNGIKCIDSDGTELPRTKEEVIESIYFSNQFSKVSWNRIGTIYKSQIIDRYIDAVISQIDLKKIKNLKIVLDCGNGASCFVSPYLLEKLGIQVITLNGHPSGNFPGHPSEPTPENTQVLAKTVKSLGADLGIIHDGDGDRTIFVDEKGNYVFGDKSLALIAKHIVVENNGGIVVVPVSTSTCVEDVVADNGGKLVYTKVGSPIVARKMMELNAVFGGEENGGYIFPRFQYCRDGLMTAVKMIEILSIENRNLSEMIEKIPKYALYKTKIYCPNELKDEVLRKLLTYQHKDEKIDTTDGVKIFLDEGWVLVRPSGTEPIYRVFGEAKDSKTAEKLVNNQLKIIKEILESGFSTKN